MWENYLAVDDSLNYFSSNVKKCTFNSVLDSWDHTGCSGQVTHKDRRKLSMVVSFIIIQTPENTTACTDSVALPSQHKLTLRFLAGCIQSS